MNKPTSPILGMLYVLVAELKDAGWDLSDPVARASILEQLDEAERIHRLWGTHKGAGKAF